MTATQIQELRSKFRGELVAPADAGYDAARKVYNGMIDKRPALIVKVDEGQEGVRASYRENYARLAQVKRKYDPANLFRVNQNIEPAEA
jgi:hypothetical protein